MTLPWYFFLLLFFFVLHFFELFEFAVWPSSSAPMNSMHFFRRDDVLSALMKSLFCYHEQYRRAFMLTSVLCCCQHTMPCSSASFVILKRNQTSIHLLAVCGAADHQITNSENNLHSATYASRVYVIPFLSSCLCRRKPEAGFSLSRKPHFS